MTFERRGELNLDRRPYRVTRETFETLGRYWSDAACRLHWPHPFLLPDWIQSWWRVFGGDTEILLCGVRDRDQLLGIAPLLREGHSARFIGNTEIFDYSDFIVRPGGEDAFAHALIRHLRSRGILRLELHGLRPDSTVLTAFRPVAHSLGGECRIEQEDVTVELRLPDTWEAYLHRLTAKQRHEVRRKFRRLYEGGRIQFKLWDPAHHIDDAIDTFMRLFNSNRRDKADFMTEEMSAYFRDLMQALARIGLLKLFVLAIDDVTAAAVMCCDYHNRRYLYNNAYDDRYRRFNVGLLSKVLSIRDGINAGIHVYDFLRGDEVYKIRLGGRPTPIYKCSVEL